MENQTERVVVLDFGGQYNQLIARRIRDLGVYSELVPYHVTAEELARMKPKGIVFSGGPASVYAEDAPACDPAIYELGIPILGICYGMQLISARYGARVDRAGKREYGKAELEVVSDSPLFRGLGTSLTVWMSHSDAVVEPPPGFRVDGRTASAPVAAMSDPDRGLYAVQFHPEVKHTEQGDEILRRFLYDVCGCAGGWTAESFIEDAVKEIRERVGEKKVLCALSGGVDSSVTAALIHRAVGDQLTCVFVDHGLLRKGEAESVMRTFRDHFRMNVVQVDARERFLSKLAGVTDPEQKRKIIGNEFIRVFEEEAESWGNTTSSGKAPCIPTSSNRERRRPRRSNPTTMWAAFRKR